ncbi:MAG: hypothetical protein AB7S50_03605 [Bacteroidales bacterium]
MNVDDLHNSLEKILNILKNGYSDNKDLLYLFSTYIASNPDFKYNATYLTDSIDRFFLDCEIYETKKLIFEEVIKYLNSVNLSKFEIEIEFDSKFKYNTADNSNLQVIVNNNNLPDIHRIGAKQFLMKLTLIKPMKIEYSHLIKVSTKSKDQCVKKVSNFIDVINKYNNEE